MIDKIQVGETTYDIKDTSVPDEVRNITSSDIEKWNENNNNTTYSTEEILIGTWIDGKPIYRKIIIASITVTTTIHIPFDIPNVDCIWINFGKSFYYKNDKSIAMGLLYYFDNQNNVRTYISGSEVQIRVNPSSWMPGTAYIVLEYTKTTD